MNNKSIWLPHLILQRNLGVKDLREVNFKANLIEHSFSEEAKAWQPQELKPDMMTQTTAITDPKDPRLDNDRGQYFDKGAREPFLVYENYTVDKKTGKSLLESIPTRGEPVEFELLGYKTFLFKNEYDLIKDVLNRIQEITIQVTYGLSPLFKVFAKLKDE